MEIPLTIMMIWSQQRFEGLSVGSPLMSESLAGRPVEAMRDEATHALLGGQDGVSRVLLGETTGGSGATCPRLSCSIPWE